MTKLTFSAEEIRPLIEHARACTEHKPYYGEEATGPGLFLVKDEGIYLMSNGLPNDMVKRPAPNGNGETDMCRVAYAKNFDPTERDRMEVWDDARAAVGGDDFSEPIGDEMWKKLLKDGVTEIVIELTEDKIAFTALRA